MAEQETVIEKRTYRNGQTFPYVGKRSGIIMFDVLYANQPVKFLKKSDKILSKRLLQKIEELQQKPVLHDSKIVVGYK